MFDKILFATDGSEHSNKVFEYVKSLYKKYYSEIIVLHSYELPLMYTNEYAEYLKKRGENILESFKQKFQEENIEVRTLLVSGDPGEMIVKYAQNESCNLITIGAHGNNEIKSLLLGSVSNYVINTSKCTVFMVN